MNGPTDILLGFILLHTSSIQSTVLTLSGLLLPVGTAPNTGEKRESNIDLTPGSCSAGIPNNKLR